MSVETVLLTHPLWTDPKERPFPIEQAINILELNKKADSGIRLAKGESLPSQSKDVEKTSDGDTGNKTKTRGRKKRT